MGFRRRRLHKAGTNPSAYDPLGDAPSSTPTPAEAGTKLPSAIALTLLVGTVLLVVFAAEIFVKLSARNG